MRIHIELSKRAFAFLESLPKSIAFDLFRAIDRISDFPEIGSPMETAFIQFKGLRQIIYKRNIRVIYEYFPDESLVWVSAIVDCRQLLPDRRGLIRRLTPDDLSLD